MDENNNQTNNAVGNEPDSPAYSPAVSEPQQPYVAPQGVQSFTDPAAPKGSNRKVVMMISLAALFIVLLAGGAAAFWLMTQNNKPEKVLADALVNTASDLLEKKPATSVGNVSFESKGDNPVKVDVSFDASVSGDNSQGAADIKATFAGATYNIKGAVASFGTDEYYIKVENIKKTLDTFAGTQPGASDFINTFNPVINKVDNQWIKITKDDLKQFGVVEEQVVDKCANTLKSLKLSGDDKKKIKTLFKENQFIIAGETLENEVISGEKSFHYKLDFNDQAAESFARQVIEMESFKQLKTDCDINEDKIKDEFKNDSGSESEKKPVVELWVGKKSRRPTKFRISTNEKDVTVDLNTEVKLGAEGVSIQKPTRSISIKELQSEFEKITGAKGSLGL